MSKAYDAGPRVRTNNFFDIGVVGRRTGITMKSNVKKDADGLDNIDDFWDDDDDNGPAVNSQNMTQDAEQDDFSGEDDFEDEVHSSPSVRKSDPRRYLEQEAPEELLLTPTSRRSRGGARGTLSGDGTIHGSHLSAGAEGTPSPSIDRIRKRLVFTKDSSNNDTEQAPPHQGHSNKANSGSPALDKILRDSQDRNAHMKTNVARAPATTNNRVPVKAVPSKAQPKPTSVQPSKAPVPSRRPANLPKAFDFGGYSDDQEDDYRHPDDDINSNRDRNDAEYPFNDVREPTPPPPPRATAAKAKAGRTASEFRQKSKAPPAWLAPSDDEDESVHDGPEDRRDDDDRLRFSDEDEPTRRDEDEESEEDEEVLQDNRRKMSAFSRKKRTASVQEPVEVLKGGKRAAGATMVAVKQKNIPQKSAPSTSARQKQRRSYDDGDEEEREEREELSEDYGKVPSMAQSKGKSKASSSTSRSNFNNSGTKKIGRATHSGHDTSSTTHEVPIVPDQNAEETGVRRSGRTKVTPLKFWMNEKVLYSKTREGPVIKSVMRAASEEAREKPKRKPRGKSKPLTVRPQRAAKKREDKGRGKEGKQEDDEESGQDRALEEDNHDSMDVDEDQAETSTGFREDPIVTADIIVFGSDDVVSKDIAESDSSIQFRNVKSGEYQLHRGLEDAGYMVTGTLKIKPNGRKPVNSGTNTSMVFYVIKGLVQVKVHESDFVISTGGRFLVPRGNTYSILNISTKESTLFFVQTKEPRSDTTEAITTSSPSAATISSSTESRTKRKSVTGGSTAAQPDPDSSERNPSPPPEDSTAAAAAGAHSRSPSPEATTPSSNKRRLTSARRLLSNARSPTPPRFLSSSTEEVANGHDGADERRQPSALASFLR
ncbi:hypothetical protein KI688_002851 [Linnemannia hyalina]|uniref:CENP-C homolog n=1 Tax=Linnemannia hyalina TaxID=64524 RepID=A0A9P7XQ41_9FUNG|nr:hypothetical protein KI688_002851 [Linnemannia hyalina]